jgi:glucose/arabinose dehydrogenase
VGLDEMTALGTTTTAARRRRRVATPIAAWLIGAAMIAAPACGSGSGKDGGAAPTTTPVPGQPTPGAPTPSGPTPTPAPSASPSGPPALRLGLVAAGLESPLFLTEAPDGSGRLYVVEQTGRIRIIEGGLVAETPFLDLSDRVSCCGERGLLGLAFHPGYAENGRFFVDYTNRDGDTEIVELSRAEGAPDRADPGSARLLLRVDQPFANHNGGALAFAPDGTLVVALGDGGGAGDPQDNARDLSAQLGKLLRLDVERHPEPPPGNVAGADPYVWQYGLRNPWRFSFDRERQDLWIGDVGQNRHEEIDFAPAGAGGLDFGWPLLEGSACFRPPAGCDPDGTALPIYDYDREAGCSVTGGYVYRGSRIPGLDGWYLFGDYCSNRLWALLRREDGEPLVVELTAVVDPSGRIRGLASFGEDLAGELYVVSLSGEVYRLEAAQD